MKLLLDSNSIIYLQPPFRDAVTARMRGNEVFISWISYPEVVGFPELSAEETAFFEDLFETLPLLSVDERLLRHAASFRRRRKTTLGDSIVAATADLFGLTILTANERDFKRFPELRFVNPLTQVRSA
jgi:hypothetical protein